MSYFIGFATKMYTLWERTTNYGYKGQTYYTFRYRKNISKDLEAAKQKYPGAEVDLTLRGTKDITRGGWTYEKPKLPEDVFQFGKYEGSKFVECTDYSYMEWYYRQCWENHPEQAEIIQSVLEPQGYGFEVNCNGWHHIYDPETWEWVKKENKIKEEYRNALKNHEPIEFFAESNLKYDGSLYIDDILKAYFDFKEMNYQGYYYGLPLDSKGKAKRIKNKNIKITDYEVIGNLEIEVKSFEILK